MSQLARRSDAPARDPITEALSVYKPEQYNILTPVSAIDRIPDEMRVRVAIVKVNTDNETYPLPGGGGKRALQKVALDRIASALGIRWTHSAQTDNYNDPHRVQFSVEGEYIDFDGMIKNAPGTKEIDLRGEPGWPEEDLGKDTREFIRQAIASEKKHAEKYNRTPNLDKAVASAWDRILSARRHIIALAESGARNRAIRYSASIQSAFKPEDLTKPFVVPALVPDPDMNDPETRRMVNARRLGIPGMLFSQRPSNIGPTVIDGMKEERPSLSPAKTEEESAVPEENSDPWDSDEPETPENDEPESIAFFPIDEDLLSQMEGRRRDYVARVDLYARSIVSQYGEKTGSELIKKHGSGIDPETASLDDLMAFGKALKSLISE